ncbi:MAG TPA: hypothetical protein VN767_10405 [Streptosporangiaceae bacterium]|nr:hypothetical protein [Streptosporangiaceae bacterium]
MTDSVQAADLTFNRSVTNKIEVLAESDSRLAADRLAGAAREAITAWTLAVDGDEARLAEIAPPHCVSYLLQPERRRWRVAPGPRVTGIEIWKLEPESGEINVSFDFTGRRQFTDPDEAARAGAAADDELQFVGMIELTLDPSGGQDDPFPWRLTFGNSQTLDEYRGYTYTVRQEEPQEYERRTGSPAGPAPAGRVQQRTEGRARRFRLLSGFAEHDEKLGSTAEVHFTGEAVPTRDEAEALIEPAIWEETTRALGQGDWRPSMNWLDVIELLDDPS